jgi:hypothetical protein
MLATYGWQPTVENENQSQFEILSICDQSGRGK